MLLKKQPYHLLLFAGLLLLLFSFLPYGERTIDIHVHDTYYVIAKGSFLWLLAIILWIAWALGFFAGKRLYSKALSWVHVAMTLLAVVFFLWLLYSGNRYLQPRSYLDASNWQSFRQFQRSGQWLFSGLLLCVAGQGVFVINLLSGLFKRR